MPTRLSLHVNKNKEDSPYFKQAYMSPEEDKARKRILKAALGWAGMTSTPVTSYDRELYNSVQDYLKLLGVI